MASSSEVIEAAPVRPMMTSEGSLRPSSAAFILPTPSSNEISCAFVSPKAPGKADRNGIVDGAGVDAGRARQNEAQFFAAGTEGHGAVSAIATLRQHTPSLRAKRSNPESFRGGSLDCFAALAMTASVGPDGP